MNRRLLPALAVCALLAPAGASAQIDCNALANSAQAEPVGYAQICLGLAISPSPGGNLGSGPGYKYNMSTFAGTQGLFNYVVASFPTETFVGNPAVNQGHFGWDWNAAGTVLYAHNSTTNQLGTVSSLDGSFTPIAALTGLSPGQSLSGIAIDPVSDQAYAVATDVTASGLYSLDLTTAVATLIGNTGVAGIIDAAIDCNGLMVAHDIVSDSFYTINLTTGASTLIGPHGLAANFAQGMDFDNSDGTLYAAVYTGGGTFTYGPVNLGTGAVTPLTTNTPPGEWEIAISNSCPAVDTDIAATKVVDDNSPAPGDTIVYTITVDNLGPADATNVVVTDTLPAGVTFVSTSGCAEDPAGVPTCSLGTIISGASASYDITATVDLGAMGDLVNMATASADNTDPVPANNSASVTVTVGQPVLEIPTLGDLGLVALALLLLVGGALLIRRRRSA